MPGIFEISVEEHFSSAHALRDYPGNCEHLHGHNWAVRVTVECKELNEIGIGIDFREVKESVREALHRLDHINLNELPPFQDINPSSENIARYLYSELSRKLNTETVRVSRVRVSETPTSSATYREI
ncbi:6-pyruvoyltetrahydropterin/6-carboxytetrahydropterin synthase [Syntrophus gentianae]|uniref:6-carboxy-5,6,7,8-tetrahydropterin synthase n=1 Tax=Syntrophus gentianae TaxID=43775 RepID=A0A1H7W9W0_9BACT|nr:6-carboxytetrahydropterin synthase QueD [Syntrophus gentianae]SEM18303.1 6-pyruvoyltetrahydropterin/6-carboxytetrahydropterin synthase [Syntrophus gentianae]